MLNLYEPVAVNAIGLALAGGDIRDLDISEQERARIRGIMAADSEKAALNRLHGAAQSVCAAPAYSGPHVCKLSWRAG